MSFPDGDTDGSLFTFTCLVCVSIHDLAENRFALNLKVSPQLVIWEFGRWFKSLLYSRMVCLNGSHQISRPDVQMISRMERRAQVNLSGRISQIEVYERQYYPSMSLDNDKSPEPRLPFAATRTYRNMTTEIIQPHIIPETCHPSQRKPLPRPNSSYNFIQHKADQALLLPLANPLQTLHRILQFILKHNNVPRSRRAEITHLEPRASSRCSAKSSSHAVY